MIYVRKIRLLYKTNGCRLSKGGDREEKRCPACGDCWCVGEREKSRKVKNRSLVVNTYCLQTHNHNIECRPRRAYRVRVDGLHAVYRPGKKNEIRARTIFHYNDENGTGERYKITNTQQCIPDALQYLYYYIIGARAREEVETKFHARR